MKKHLLVLSVALFLLGLSVAPSLSFAETYLPGCTSKEGFSATTGLSCNSKSINWINKTNLMANALNAVSAQRASSVKNTAPVQPTTTVTTTTTSTCSLTKTLSKGMDDLEVKCLQQKLSDKGFKVAGVEKGSETTVFGSNTMTAVKKFQTSKQLKADGVVGQTSREALNK